MYRCVFFGLSDWLLKFRFSYRAVPPATANQMVHNRLVNHKPIICAVCDRYISPLTGLPVILEDKEQIIEFAHPACCTHKD